MKSLETETYGFNMYKLEYYTTDKIKDNWKLFWKGEHVGNLHDNDGIGGSYFKSYEELMSKRFERFCELAKINLFRREKWDFSSSGGLAFQSLVRLYLMEELDVKNPTDRDVAEQVASGVSEYGSGVKMNFMMRRFFSLLSEEERKKDDDNRELNFVIEQLKKDINSISRRNDKGVYIIDVDQVEHCIDKCLKE